VREAKNQDFGEFPQNPGPGARALGRKAGKSAKAKPGKAAKPKPISNDRDKWVDLMAAQFNSDISKAIEALVMALSGYDGVIQSKLSLSARQRVCSQIRQSDGRPLILEI
jgi:hypothetical protein